MDDSDDGSTASSFASTINTSAQDTLTQAMFSVELEALSGNTFAARADSDYSDTEQGGPWVLAGTWAPALNQPGGSDAMAALTELLAMATVHMVFEHQDAWPYYEHSGFMPAMVTLVVPRQGLGQKGTVHVDASLSLVRGGHVKIDEDMPPACRRAMFPKWLAWQTLCKAQLRAEQAQVGMHGALVSSTMVSPRIWEQETGTRNVYARDVTITERMKGFITKRFSGGRSQRYEAADDYSSDA